MTEQNQLRGKRSQARAKTYEREVARKLGGRRHLANTGGPEDVEHDVFAIQVKSGLAVVTQTMRDALASARAAAVGTGKLATVALVDRKGGRLGWWICFDMGEFADFHGYGAAIDDDGE